MDKTLRHDTIRKFLLIFFLAMAVRGLFLFELRTNSYYGNMRISDAQSYHMMALQLVEGSFDDAQPFWQPPLYLYLLSFLYLVIGSSLLHIRMFHILISSLNCALLYYVSLLFFSRRTAIVGGLIACLYAPCWVFDIQPLAESVIVMFYLLVMLMLYSFHRQRRLFTLFVAGFLLGAAVISHGLALFVIPCACAWLVYTERKLARPAGEERHGLGKLIMVFVAAAAICPAVVSFRNFEATGKLVFISNKAGINLYIGNHPQYAEIVGRRNGFEWEEFQRQILEANVLKSSDINSYFVREALKNIRNHPAAVARTVGKKLIIILSGAEAKRNFPIYPLREQSGLLRSALWCSDFTFFRFFFPTGLIIPLAALGTALVLKRKTENREFALLPLMIAAGHIAGLAVFHVCSRYRLPALFILFPCVAIGMTFAWDMFLKRFSSGSAECSAACDRNTSCLFTNPFLLLFVFMLVISNFSGDVLKPETREKDFAEHCYYQGLWLCDAGHVPEGLTLFRTAMAHDPSYPEPKFALGCYYYHLYGDPERALRYFNELKKMLPWHPKIEAKRRLVANDLERNQ